jgi:hypothetical protein
LVQAGEIGDFTVIISLPIDKATQRSKRMSLRFTEVIGEQVETVVEETRFWAPE